MKYLLKYCALNFKDIAYYISKKLPSFNYRLTGSYPVSGRLFLTQLSNFVFSKLNDNTSISLMIIALLNDNK